MGKKKVSKKTIITLIVSLLIGIGIIAAIIVSDYISGDLMTGTEYIRWFHSDYSIGLAALVAVIGIAVVLVILLVLILLLVVFNKTFGAIEKAAERAAEKSESVQTAEAEETVTSEDEETVAAITAAISCILASENESGTPPPFTVRRIKQVDKMKGKRQ